MKDITITKTNTTTDAIDQLQDYVSDIVEELTQLTSETVADYINETCLSFETITDEIEEGTQTPTGAEILRTYGGPTVVIEVNNFGGFHYYTTVTASIGWSGETITAHIDAPALESFVEAVIY